MPKETTKRVKIDASREINYVEQQKKNISPL